MSKVKQLGTILSEEYGHIITYMDDEIHIKERYMFLKFKNTMVEALYPISVLEEHITNTFKDIVIEGLDRLDEEEPVKKKKFKKRK